MLLKLKVKDSVKITFLGKNTFFFDVKYQFYKSRNV